MMSEMMQPETQPSGLPLAGKSEDVGTSKPVGDDDSESDVDAYSDPPDPDDRPGYNRGGDDGDAKSWEDPEKGWSR